MADAGVRSRARWAVAVAALLLVAAALRLPGLGRESLWFDEIESARLSDGDLGEVCHDAAASVHPPLYFLALHLSRSLVGSGDAALRLPGVLASLAGLLALWLLARDLGGPRVGALALLLGAVNPLDVYYAQEARMYAPAAALGTLTAWLLWRWLAAGDRSATGGWRWLLAYGLAAAAALYTHYLTALLLLAQGLFAAARLVRRRQWPRLAAYAGTGLAVAAAFLPWIGYVRSLRAGLYADEQMDWMLAPGPGDALAFLGREVFWGLAGHATRWGAALTSALAALLLLAVAWSWRRSPGEPAAARAYPAWLALAPVALAVAASHLYRPVYYPERFAELVLAPLLAVAAIACAELRPARLGVAVAVALVSAMAVGTAAQARTPLKTDWRGLAREWPRDRAPARLVCYPPYVAYCLGHYLGAPPAASAAAAVLAEAHRLRGAELWVVTSCDYPLELRPGDRDDRDRLLGLGARSGRVLAGCWRLDVVRVGQAPPAADGPGEGRGGP